jgi:nucleoside-diphosphate-sugar epimerase
MRALVTGCAGFIGSNLTDRLLQDGNDVIGVDCFNDNYGRPDKLRNLEHARSWTRFDFVPVDLSRGDVGDLVAGCDVVFHLAAEPGVRSSWGQRFDNYLRNNVLATQHLLEAARECPEKRFVYASSSSVYGQAESYPTPETALPRPYSPYGVTKLAGEHLCQLYHSNFGVETVSLRFFSVFGPRQRPDMAFTGFMRAAVQGDPITILGDGRQTRDFTYVMDVVDVALAAAAMPGAAGGVYNVGGGSRTPLIDAVEMIGELAARPLQLVHLPAEAGDVRDTAADTTLVRAALDFAPRVSLREGLEAQFEWMRAALAASTTSMAGR